MDQREYVHDPEETLRTVVAGLMRGYWTAMPVQVTEDTKDGHSAVPQPTIKRSVTDPITGLVSYVDHQIHPDVPIHYAGGGGVTATHPVKKGDEGIVVYADRALDAWRTQGGTAQPIDDRQHHLGDGMLIPGVRSDPRKLQQVSNDAHHVRSDDKHHVSEVHPEKGVSHKSVDPSTPPASADFDPHTQATKFIEHIAQALQGVMGRAVDGSTEHSHGVDHGVGAWMKAANGLHSVLADPSNGASLNAQNGLNSVLAHPTQGSLLSGNNGSSTVVASLAGVVLNSNKAINLSAPSIGLPAGSVSGAALASGAGASNIGALGGDLAGTLPNPQVVGLGHVDAHLLPQATSDAAAAALNPPVPVGGLYLNTSFVLAGTVSNSSSSSSGGGSGGSGSTSSTTLPASGIAVLCVRMV